MDALLRGPGPEVCLTRASFSGTDRIGRHDELLRTQERWEPMPSGGEPCRFEELESIPYP
jgi:hypothetical protein